MALGTLCHLSLVVRDRPQSAAFYDRILNFLGYQRVEDNDEFTMWWSAEAGAIALVEAPPTDTPQISPVQLQHLAFQAESREQVDACHQLLQLMNAPILQPPATHDEYAPGYYAVFFADPEGVRLEVVHLPKMA